MIQRLAIASLALLEGILSARSVNHALIIPGAQTLHLFVCHATIALAVTRLLEHVLHALLASSSPQSMELVCLAHQTAGLLAVPFHLAHLALIV